MKIRIRLVWMCAVSILFISCKEDTKQEETIPVETVESEASKEVYKPTAEEIMKESSVMAKLMLTKECSRFSSYLLTANLTDTLFYKSGPFTVFAPDNESIDALGSEFSKNLTQKQKLDSLTVMMKRHIVNGEYDSVTLVQSLKSGPVVLTTLSGEKLTVSKKGSDIVLKNQKGEVATLGKTDIKGANGVLHLVDAFLGNY